MSRLWVLIVAGLAAGFAGAAGDAAREQQIAIEAFDPVRLGRAIFIETNRVRRAHGLREFEASELADEAAAIQARLGFAPGKSGHGNPFPRVATLTERLDWVGLKAAQAGENVARLPVAAIGRANEFAVVDRNGRRVAVDPESGCVLPEHTYQSLAADLVRRWMESPSHRANIMRADFTALGCAVQLANGESGLEVVNAVQVFVRPVKGWRRGR